VKKELELSVKFDTSDFDKSVESMQKKLKEIYAPADAVRAQTQTNQRLQQLGLGSTGGGASADQMAKATQNSRRESDLAIREQVKGQEQLGKLLAARESVLEKMKKQQQEAIRDTERELELRKKIGDIEVNNARMREVMRGKDQAINAALDRREQFEIKGGSDYGKTPNDFAGAMDDFSKSGSRQPSGAMGMIGKGLGGIGGALVTAAGIAEGYTGYGQRLEAAKGSAIQNTTGKDLQDVYSGRSPFEMNFMKEREAASGLAAQKEDRNRWTDRVKGIGYGAVIAGGAALSTTGLGALLGVPMMAAGAAGLSNDRTRKGIFGGDEYEQLLAAERGGDFRKSYEDLKNQDVEKKATVQGFEQNSDRNVRAQRMMGLSNKQFYGDGGFMEETKNAGFSTEQGLQNASAIIGAGGSSRMANNPLGLQADRAGLNGAQMVGTLSGSLQAPEANKRAMISIMSEAFKTGLDATEFAEENRKFTQAAANIIGKTGVTGEADQDRLVGVLGSLLGNKTNQGVAQAQSDYEKVQQRSSQTSGRRGALKFSASMQDPLLGKASTSDQAELMSMRDEDLNEQNPAIGAIARSIGPNVTNKQVIDAAKKANQSGRFLSPGQKDRMSASQAKVQKYMDDNGLAPSDLGKQIQNGTAPQEVSDAVGRMKLEMSKTDSTGGITSGEGIGSIGEFLHSGKKDSDTKGKAEKDLKGSERIEDAYTKKAAEGADEARQAFNRLTTELWNVVKGADALKESVSRAGPGGSAVAKENLKNLPQGSGTNEDVLARRGIPAEKQPTPNKPKDK